MIRRLPHNAQLVEQCFTDVSAYRINTGIAGWLGRLYLNTATHSIANHLKACVEKEGNAWNYANAGKLMRFVRQNRWFENILARGLDDIQCGTQAGEPAVKADEVRPRVRTDKPWGWEVILTTVRERIGGAEEGYTEKYLIVAGPLSNQKHETYIEDGKEHAAKVETQTVYGPSPYLMRINGGGNSEEIYELGPGDVFHIAKGTWHQPGVRPGDLCIIKETSKPNIGPGSTTRDPDGDPWRGHRASDDIP